MSWFVTFSLKNNIETPTYVKQRHDSHNRGKSGKETSTIVSNASFNSEWKGFESNARVQHVGSNNLHLREVGV